MILNPELELILIKTILTPNGRGGLIFHKDIRVGLVTFFATETVLSDIEKQTS